MLFCRQDPPFPSSVSLYIDLPLHPADYHLSRWQRNEKLTARCSVLGAYLPLIMQPQRTTTPPGRCKSIDHLFTFPGNDLLPFLWNTTHMELSADGAVDHPFSYWMLCRPCGVVHIHFPAFLICTYEVDIDPRTHCHTSEFFIYVKRKCAWVQINMFVEYIACRTMYLQRSNIISISPYN